MFSKQKGITPVIAIVLLLLITVGAVGVVYTQFQGLTENNDAQQQLQENQRLQAASYSIVGVASTDSSNPANGNINVTLRNTGNTVINLTQQSTLLVGKDGGQPVAVTVQNGNACKFGALSGGDTATCNTGLSWGQANNGQPTTIQLQVSGVTKASYTCTEDGSQYC